MYVVIGGAGNAGLHLGRELRRQGHEVAFVEQDGDMAAEAGAVDALVVEGDVRDVDALLEAGVDRSHYYIGTVTRDSDNLVSCALANHYGCGTIARVKSPSLAGQAFSTRFSVIGTDVALCPSLIAASQIARVFAFPSRLGVVRDSGIRTFHTTVEGGCRACDAKMEELALPDGSRVVSVFRGVEQLLPEDSLVLQPEDELALFLDDDSLVGEVEGALGVGIHPYREIRDVFIAGTTDVGLSLADQLLDSDIDVVIMDISEKRARDAAERFPAASVVHSNPLDQGVLKQEEIRRFDVLMAMGSNVERNIFTSILAKQLGVPAAIALIDHIELKEAVEETLVDNVVVPNLRFVKTILHILHESEGQRRRFRRRRAIRRLPLQTDEILVERIPVNREVRCVGKTVGNFPPSLGDFLISGVVHDGEGMVPEDDYVIADGDELLVLHHARAYGSVKRWLTG